MKRLLTLSTLAVALVLAACNGDLNGPIPPTDPFPGPNQAITAVASPNQAIRTNETVTRNSADYYRVRLPANLSQPLVYVELANVSGGQAQVEIWSVETPRSPVYRSTRPEYFGLAGQVAPLELEDQQVNVDIQCRGPCIILERQQPVQETWIYVRVSTSSNTPVRYNLHVYDDPHNDPGEPAVSQCPAPAFPQALETQSLVPNVFEAVGPAIASSDVELAPEAIIVTPVRYRAALETVGDRDCYRVQANVNRVEFTSVQANTGINMRARIYNANTGALISTLNVTPQNRVATSAALGNVPVNIIVDSTNGRAGPSGTSGYFLDFPN